MNDRLWLREHFELYRKSLFETDVTGELLTLKNLLKQTHESGEKVIFAGNGGSAAIVQHMHNDLCKCVGVRALVFDDVSLMTALANDDGYERVFEMPTRLWLEIL